MAKYEKPFGRSKYPFCWFTVVVQLNKRDLPNAISVPVLQKTLDFKGFPTIGATTIQGEGVFDTLKIITNGVIKRVQQEVA